MPSNAQRGAYWKSRTRKWLLTNGWQVADLEIVKTIYPKGYGAGESFNVKRDQFGADLMAMNQDRIVFIQVKGGVQAKGSGTFPAARREFAKFTFAVGTHRWIVAWAPRAREPRIVKCQ